MKLRKRLFVLSIALFSVAALFAQKKQVTGKVIDDLGEGLPGVSISIKGTKNGTLTDIEGNYTISVAGPQSVLVYSFVGMATKEEKVGSRTVINITMASTAIELNEVVAIGYGTTSRKDLTGSVASIQASDIANIPVTNVAQALAGKIAGVNVTQSQGSPDAEISIRVRGGMSISQSNEPLYIIDGFPTEDGLRGIDPSDIESVDVLKDASASAIYGSRGANGVILVTTKSGKEGKGNITFDTYVGFKKITKKLDVLSPLDFVKLDYERSVASQPELDKIISFYGNWNDYDDLYGNRKGVDWQDEVFEGQNALSQMYKIGVNGGTKTTQYNASYTFNKDNGIMEGSGLKRHSFRLKLGQQILPTVKLNANLSYTDETTTGMGSLSDGGQFSRMQHIVQYRPVGGLNVTDEELLTSIFDSVFDDSGNQMQNPLISIRGEERTRRNRYFNANADVQWKILKNLTYRGSVGMRNRDYRQEEFYTKDTRQAKNSGAPYGSIQNRTYETFTYSNTLTYNQTFKKIHRFDVMAGQEYIYGIDKSLNSMGYGFPVVNFGVNDMGASTTKDLTSSVQDNTMLSFFARANYQLRNKYLFSASLRTDGSSKFGANHKWGVFPAASAAWRISEEQFMKEIDVFSNLKLRYSYGTSGNNRIDNYASLALLNLSWIPNGSGTTPSYNLSQLPNPDLKWETIISNNLGLDMGFLDQRIQASVDLYYNKTKDLLFKANIPQYNGFDSQIRNIGKTQNKGIEVSITTYNIQNKKFTWTTNLNFSANKNKVMQLNESDFMALRSGWCTAAEFNAEDYMLRVGEPMGQMYGFVSDGIYQVDDFVIGTDGKFAKDKTGNYVPKEGVIYNPAVMPKPGDWKYKDTDGNETIDDKDKKVIGNANPKIFGGFTNTFTYKGFDLSIFFNFSIGNDVYNANKMYYTKMSNKYRNSLGVSNERFRIVDEWGKNIVNDPNALREANKNASMASISGAGNLVFSSWYVENGSYLRLNNVTLGYTFPKMLLKKAKISSLRLYATGYNLCTITGYSGFDPEVNSKSNGNMTPGIDWGAYPRSFSMVFGLNLTF